MLDVGPGTFAALMEAGLLPDAIVLSHGHPDHCSDLVFLFQYLRFDRPEVAGLPVLAPPGVADLIADFLDASTDHPFHRVFDFRVVGPGDGLTLGATTLRFGAAAHPVPSVVVRVECDGVSLVYSGDTGPGGDLQALAAGCDLLLCEATHQGPPGPDRYPYHLHAVEAGEIATDAGVGRLLLTHVAPTLEPGVSVAEAALTFSGPIDFARPGMEVEL
ncbi:MAG: MBL fold metallo-hydrolase [Acidimicrobiia bacterium]|nr:MAG: MBL fold metallo-hydrolase [Acidimicrobiia bacterium]